jgi:hypothetical protein
MNHESGNCRMRICGQHGSINARAEGAGERAGTRQIGPMSHLPSEWPLFSWRHACMECDNRSRTFSDMAVARVNAPAALCELGLLTSRLYFCCARGRLPGVVDLVQDDNRTCFLPRCEAVLSHWHQHLEDAFCAGGLPSWE